MSEALLDRLLQPRSWEETRNLILSQPLLLDPIMDTLITQRLTNTVDEDDRSDLIAHQQLLGLCRLLNIDDVFAILVQPITIENMIELYYHDPTDNPAHNYLYYHRALTTINPYEFPVIASLILRKMARSIMLSNIGDCSENRKVAIYHIEIALVFVTRPQYPDEWAETKDMLASLYYLNRGEQHSEFLEKSIYCYRELLTYWTKTSNPNRWAVTTRRLALSLFNRIQGSKIENVEESIRLFHHALAMCPKLSDEWATTATSLGQAYLNRGHGDVEENIVTAISLLEEALDIREKLDDRSPWCESVIYLSQALWQKNRGRRIELSNDRERAIALLQESLTIQEKLVSEDNHPMYQATWITLKGQLAQAYEARIQGYKQENLHMAAKHWRDGLAHLSEKTEALTWSSFLLSLSAVLIDIEDADRAQNIENAIQSTQQAMRIQTRELAPEHWATACDSLARAYTRRLEGDKAENQLKGLSYRQKALEVFSLEEYPHKWIQSMIQLGVHHSSLIKGDHENNLDTAISCWFKILDQAASHLTCEQKAKILLQLGNAYTLRRTGAREKNLERAKRYFEDGRALVDHQEHPFIWAQITHNLASLILHFMKGDDEEKRRKWFQLYKEYSGILSFEHAPAEWAVGRQNLALYYINLEEGDHSNHQAKAISILKEVLQRLDSDIYEQAWLQTRLLFAKAIINNEGDTTENLETAIDITRSVFERKLLANKNPQIWLHTGLALADNYRLRLRGDRFQNQMTAMKIAEQCLTFVEKIGREEQPTFWIQTMLTMIKITITWEDEGHIDKKELGLELCQKLYAFLKPESYPDEYLETTKLLADAWSGRYKGEREQNFETAIKLYESVLRQLDRHKHPIKWAETLNHLAGVYRDRRRGDKAENHAKSIELCRKALEVFTLEHQPEMNHVCWGNLGKLYFANRKWAEALEAFEHMLHAADFLFQTAPTQEARRAQMRLNADLPARAANCLARMLRFEEAVVLMERYRTKTLIELLQERNIASDDELRQEILSLEGRLRLLSDDEQTAYTQISRNLGQKRLRLLELRQKHDTEEDLSFDEIHAVARTTGKALVYLAVPWLGGFALIVPPFDISPKVDLVVWLHGALSSELRSMLHNYDEDKATGYLQAFTDVKKNPNFLDEIMPYVAENIMEPILERLDSLGIDEAVLMPQGFLGLLPLHAFSPREIVFSYAPSCRILRQGLANMPHKNVTSFLAMGNSDPEHGLKSAALEISLTSEIFSQNNHRVFNEVQADLKTLEELSVQTTHLHLACHGVLDLTRPMESKIQLGEKQSLSLRFLLDDKIRFERTRLVFLSACETGVIDFRTVPDENIGLPVGFLMRGIPGVISTLWKVDDLAASLLSLKFYEHLLGKGQLAPAKALHLAQHWLRNLRFEEVEPYLVEINKHFDTNVLLVQLGHELLLNPNEKPFEHPVYWAPFILNGQ